MVAAKIATLPAWRPAASASIEAPSQPQAADLLNVSRSGVQRARTILEHGQPELIAAVEGGEIAVSTAATANKKNAGIGAGRLGNGVYLHCVCYAVRA
jgi:hypothetical protein